jgi:hypothetical protein
MESEKGFSEVKRRNDERMLIPLLQGLHTQHESTAASALGLSGRHGSSIIDHLSSKQTAEEMNSRSTGIGMKKSENRL